MAKYKVKGHKNLDGKALMFFANIEQGEEVYYHNSGETMECECCGKPTYWRLEGKYTSAVGTKCIKNLDLELVK